MAEVVFLVLCMAGAFVAGHAPGAALGLGRGACRRTLVWQTGLLHGDFEEPPLRCWACWPGCRWSSWPACRFRPCGAPR